MPLFDLEKDEWDQTVQHSLRPKDHLLVQVQRKELWVKIMSKMFSQNNQKIRSDFDVKFDITMSGKDLKKMVQKIAIKIWNQIQNSKKEDEKAIDKDSFANVIV